MQQRTSVEGGSDQIHAPEVVQAVHCRGKGRAEEQNNEGSAG